MATYTGVQFFRGHGVYTTGWIQKYGLATGILLRIEK